MFQFPGFTFHKLCIHLWIHGVSHVSFLIRKSSDLWLCAPTRSLSQLITSFIGSWCQGIHHAPFVAWPIQSKFFKVLHLISQRIFLGLLLNMFWSYILFMCNFQRTIKFAINFALLCRLRRCAAHLSNKFRYSLLVSKYCSFLSNFEKHGFSKLNRLVKPVIF